MATAGGEGTAWDPETQTCIVANPADINFDGCVQLNDLLDLLSAYGGSEAEASPWLCGDPLEYQGYDYETVQIGEQCWFAENARYLPFVSPSDLGWEDDGGAHAYVAGYEGTSVEEAMTQSEVWDTLQFCLVQESLKAGMYHPYRRDVLTAYKLKLLCGMGRMNLIIFSLQIIQRQIFGHLPRLKKATTLGVRNSTRGKLDAE